MSEDELITIQIAARIIGVNPMSVRHWIWKGCFPSIKLGPKIIRVYRVDVLYLKANINQIKKSNPFGNQNKWQPCVVARSLSFPSQDL